MRLSSPCLATTLFTALTLPLAHARAGDTWPGWRGPTGMGQSDEKKLPLEWSIKKNVRWKAPLLPAGKVRADQNQSSPIVWKKRVFVTVSFWPEGVSEKEYPEHHVLCFDADTGAPLWDKKVEPGPWKLSDIRGGYTAPTPACDGERVYVLFGSAVLAALDMDGASVWRKEIAPHFFDVAIGTSPVLYRDTVLVVCDQLKNASSIKAFDAKTGALRWEKARPSADWAHSTPTLASINGKTQLLVATANGPQGLDPASGDVLWSFRTGNRVGDTVSPVFHAGLVYIDSGRGGPAVTVDATGMGDVSKTHLKWGLKSVSEGFSSPVVVGDLLFRAHAPDLVSCIRWKTGEIVFKEHLPGIERAASPIATADGRIYFAGAGKSYVLRAGDKLEVLGTGDLGDASQASPAIAAGRIYLKGRRQLFCVEK
ncbi:MAG: PQQ-binding-like beta-propeller repeat protein [Gemmataceae bacterium]